MDSRSPFPVTGSPYCYIPFQVDQSLLSHGTIFHYLLRNSSIPFAAALPAPIARITVAAPVTASPPAYTPSFVV